MSKNELGHGRDFAWYGKQMDAGLQMKLDEMGSYIVPGFIVDCGFGTAAVLDALTRNFATSRFLGIDYSGHFVESALAQFKDRPRVLIAQGNLNQLAAMGIRGATTFIFSSSLHEVYSYHEYDQTPVLDALSGAYNALVPGGRILIRDGIAPDRATVALWCSDEDGERSGDIEKLSTQTMFKRFCRVYRHAVGIPTDTVRFNGKVLHMLRARDAYEFINKMNYRRNWPLEVNEEFGFWRKQEWFVALKRAGFKTSKIHIKEITNPWIVANRYEGHVKLFNSWTHKPLPYFPTHAVIVAEK